MVPYKNGKCFFLPNPREEIDLIINVIDNLDKLYSSKDDVMESPDWISDFLTKKEKELFQEKETIEKQLGKYSIYKQLLWATGKNLKNTVYNALVELDIDVIKLPIDSSCDLEINLDDDLTGVCEVKGLSKQVSKDDMRQLLEYYIEQRDFQERNVRGIFIVNHYRDNKPEERDEPLNQGAKELSDRHQFKVLTTVELYELLLKKWQGQFSKEDLLESLRS